MQLFSKANSSPMIYDSVDGPVTAIAVELFSESAGDKFEQTSFILSAETARQLADYLDKAADKADAFAASINKPASAEKGGE